MYSLVKLWNCGEVETVQVVASLLYRLQGLDLEIEMLESWSVGCDLRLSGLPSVCVSVVT